MPKKLRVRTLIGPAGAIVAGVALSRFTSGDWMGGAVFSAAVAALCAWYFLAKRRPRDTRRY